MRLRSKTPMLKQMVKGRRGQRLCEILILLTARLYHLVTLILRTARLYRLDPKHAQPLCRDFDAHSTAGDDDKGDLYLTDPTPVDPNPSEASYSRSFSSSFNKFIKGNTRSATEPAKQAREKAKNTLQPFQRTSSSEWR